MQLNVAGVQYEVLDTSEPITIADSFVVPANKLGSGNGEAKLYVGQIGDVAKEFFGKRGFELDCFMLKSDLLKYLVVTKQEYLKPEQPYRAKLQMPLLFSRRVLDAEALPEVVPFSVRHQSQLQGPRIYVNSSDAGYSVIRELSLPNITFVTIVKLRGPSGELRYYFRLFADFFGEAAHPAEAEEQSGRIDAECADPATRDALQKARVGQGEYRRKLLEECQFCPITGVADDRVLVASHIKPWASSNDAEKIDPKNGFMLTPTFDRLFDRGFMSFTDDRRTILSPFLSNMVYSKLGISDGKIIRPLPIAGRERYLEYHRDVILKR